MHIYSPYILSSHKENEETIFTKYRYFCGGFIFFFRTNIKLYTLTASEFSRERCSMEVAPEICARAAARALTGPFSFISN